MNDALPSRRRFLSGGLAAATTAVAGCLGSLGVDGADPDGSDPERSLVLTLSSDEGALREKYVVDLAETPPERDEVAFAAVLDGEACTTQYRRPFYSTPEDPKYAVRDGTYYRLGAVVVDEAAERRPVLRLREVEGSEDPDAIPADGLPEGDRRAVHIAYMAARARDDQGGVPWGLVQRGGYVYRREEALEASRLLSAEGPDRVVYRETTYAVDVTRGRFHEPVYRATAEPVADSPERMEAILRAKFLDARFARDDLSSEARQIIQSASGDGYAESRPYSSAYRMVLRTLNAYPYLDGDVENDALPNEHSGGRIRYDGEYYDYRLRFRGGAG
jgi:hypothetical protein